MSTPKKPSHAVEDPHPTTPARSDGPTHTVIVAEGVDPPEVQTAAMPAWPSGEAATNLPVTEPTPAWPEPAASVTDETPVLEVDPATTRPVVHPPPQAEATVPQLAPVDSSAHLRGVTTVPSKVPPGRNGARLKLLLSGAVALLAASIALLATRPRETLDPSRPLPLATAPQVRPLPKEPPPRAAPRVDVNPELVAKEAPRPPLTMELRFDAGPGEVSTRTVPASIVRLETEPMVRVSWNGEDYGFTPVLITMPVGPNLITVENKEVGLKRTLAITAAPEERTFLRYEFAKGWLSIDRPPSATTFVDGVRVKERTITLWEGRHRVDVTFRGGQKASKTAEVVRGETAELFFDEPLPNE